MKLGLTLEPQNLAFLCSQALWFIENLADFFVRYFRFCVGLLVLLQVYEPRIGYVLDEVEDHLNWSYAFSLSKPFYK